MAWKWTQTIASWFTKLIQSLASLNTLLEDNTIQNAYEIDTVPNLDKVYVTLINHSSASLGMQNSAKMMKTMLLTGDDDLAYAKEENISWTNYMEETPTKEELKARILEQIQKVPEGGLYIFFYGGHGGAEKYGTRTCQCLFLGNNLKVYDYELWEMFKQCKGRIFAVFDCCHAGTMYREPGNNEEYCRPFGINWIQNCNQVFPKGTQLFTNYSGDLASSDYDTYAAQFKDKEPVYVKLTDSDGVKMVVYSASPEQFVEVASPDGGFFTRSMNGVWKYTMKDGTYEEFFNKVYQEHRLMVRSSMDNATYNGHKYAGMSLCTYTDGFDPSIHKMFR